MYDKRVKERGAIIREQSELLNAYVYTHNTHIYTGILTVDKSNLFEYLKKRLRSKGKKPKVTGYISLLCLLTTVYHCPMFCSPEQSLLLDYLGPVIKT